MSKETEQQFDKRHGGAWDRGGADSYYRRPYKPHKYASDTGISERIEDLSTGDVEAYEAGYEHNEALGYYKEWD
jgi:hypothetical protein